MLALIAGLWRIAAFIASSVFAGSAGERAPARQLRGGGSPTTRW
jgi:hypothetical protein